MDKSKIWARGDNCKRRTRRVDKYKIRTRVDKCKRKNRAEWFFNPRTQGPLSIIIILVLRKI